MGITPEHRELLRSAAITDAVIDASGIRSTPTGLSFPWKDGNGPVQWQQRPDKPFTDDDGRPVKYLFPKGARMAFNVLRTGEERFIVAEGTKQQYAVLSHAPVDFGVLGLSGCWNWNDADFTVLLGKDVFVLFDGDIETNPDVHSAASAFSKRARLNGARSVRYVLTTAQDKQGIDDVLATMPEVNRARMLKLWLSQASERLPARPKKKRRDVEGKDPERFFHQSDKPMKLSPLDSTVDLLARHPAAITRDKVVAMYTDGRYEVDSNSFLAAMTDMFGNLYSPTVRTTMEEFMRGYLAGLDMILPERSRYRLLNCTNGMLDLVTLELLPHDPKYLSSVQIPVEWDPEATAPTYESWVAEACGSQVDDLEEVASTMLDPTRTPTKALFLFGPSRSGKSTFLRLLKAVAGHRNTSAVTLHQLAEDRFATANVYGKMLNVAADLSSRHVDDLAEFKMLTGEDELNANRKYGQQFTFTNQALFAFSANELPTVSESSRAYSERIKPFEFPNSFAGREDHSLEEKLMEELPGILVRWVKAWQRYHARRGYAVTAASVRAQFEAKSDRVVQFVQDMCEVVEAREGMALPAGRCTGRRDVAQAFNQWAKRNGGSEMGERKVFERLRNIAEIVEVRAPRGARAFNLIVRADNEDRWEDEPGPQEEEAFVPAQRPVEVTVDPTPTEDAIAPHAAAEALMAEAGPAPVPTVLDGHFEAIQATTSALEAAAVPVAAAAPVSYVEEGEPVDFGSGLSLHFGSDPALRQAFDLSE